MSVLQRGDRLGVSSRRSVGRWVFAEVERDLISESTREGLARAKSSGSSRETPTEAEIQLHEHPRAQAERRGTSASSSTKSTGGEPASSVAPSASIPDTRRASWCRGEHWSASATA